MKTILRFFSVAALCLVVALPGNAQNRSSCCQPAGASGKTHGSCCRQSASAEFAKLGEDPAFAEAHPAPLPISFVPHGGEMISIPCSDGKPANAFFIKSSPGTGNYLLMLHEWWGLNDYMKREAERLFHEVSNVNVLLIDMFDGKTAATTEDASALMKAADEKRIEVIINGALAFTKEDAVIQTIGWCFGGTWSLQTALMAGKKTAGCVMYYGEPETNLERLRTLNGPFLGIFADRDKWITRERVDAFENDLKSLKITYTFNRYDADHAFANPSNPQYDQNHTRQAHAAATAFLKKNFSSRK